MKLGRCDSCSTKLRFGSATCRRCGAKKRRARYVFMVVIAVQICTIVWFMDFHHASQAATVLEDPAPAALDAPPPRLDATPANGWLYFDTHDRMLDDVTKHARLLGRGVASDQAGGITGILELQASPIYGRSVVVTFDRRDFETTTERCTVQLQFDGAATPPMQASVSSDTVHTVLVIDGAKAFTDRVVGARTMTMDMQFAGKADRSANFEVAGLAWK